MPSRIDIARHSFFPQPVKLNVAAGSLFTGDIQFGLSDIYDRLRQLNRQIIFESDSGYRRISYDIIDELIDGSFEGEIETNLEIPTEEELNLFLFRLEQNRWGPYPPVATPNLARIFHEDALPMSSRKFLRYFLNKLLTVIKKSQEIEMPVDGFVDCCNKYLFSKEPSTVVGVGENDKDPHVLGKALRLNRRNLEVCVENLPGGRKISLDALSSGEKQMISLFAKLFLYSGKKIVLIDEPELSLSIDWQAEILVDVLNAPLCEQIIAITHSPFVFNNALEPFAKSLSVSVDAAPQQEPIGSDDEDHLDE